MKEINEKEISDFAEIGNLVQEYINGSLHEDALTALADTIKYKIDGAIQQRYGAEDLDKAKVNMASKISIERIDRVRNSAQSDYHLEEMRKYDPSQGGMDLTQYNSEKANYDFYQNEISHNNDNISRFNEDLKGLTNKGVNLGYSVLKNTGEIVSLYQLGEAYYKDDQNEIVKTAAALGIGMVADILATAFITAFGTGALVGLIVPIAVGISVGYAASKFWDHFEVGKKIGMNPDESFLDPLMDALGINGKEISNFIRNNLPFAAAGYFVDPKSGPSLSKAEHTASPIILDLDGDGVETISLSNGIYFDHDANTFAEKTGWVGVDDGLLVLDINNNGVIDSGAELFGNNTYLNNGSLAKNGYQALQELDDNHNGKIDQADSIWKKLQVWQDANSNGRVEAGELLSLDDLKIDSISTSYTNSSVIDDNGNSHSQNGKFTFTDGTINESSDVWFDMNKGDTRYTAEMDLSNEILAMPYIRGFGNIQNLHIAMATNTELKTLIEQFIASPTDNNINSIVDDIIYSWSGVSNIETNSRGSYIDARQLTALEFISGENYHNATNSTTNPLSSASAVLSNEYQKFHLYVLAQLLAQTI